MSSIPQILHSAYSFIRGVESNKAAGSLTLDHLLQDQIDRLKQGSVRTIVDSRGNTVDQRISLWDRLDALQQDVEKAVDAVKQAGDDADRLAALGLRENNQ
jgi:hypothetical protein